MYNDGGLFFCCQEHYHLIPGFSNFCNDHKNVDDKLVLIDMFTKLKESEGRDHGKYHKYLAQYKNQNKRQFYKFRRKFGRNDPCLF